MDDGTSWCLMDWSLGDSVFMDITDCTLLYYCMKVWMEENWLVNAYSVAFLVWNE